MRVVYLCVLAIFGCCLCLTQPDHGCKQTMDGDKTTKPCITRETYKMDYYNILGKTTPDRVHPDGVSIGSGSIGQQSKVWGVGHVSVDQYSDLSVDELIFLLESVQADSGTTDGAVGYYHQIDDNLLTTRTKRSISRRFPIRKPRRPIPKPRPKPRRPFPKPRPKPRRPIPKPRRPIPKPRRPIPKPRRPIPKPRRPKPRKPSPKPRRPLRRRIGRG